MAADIMTQKSQNAAPPTPPVTSFEHPHGAGGEHQNDALNATLFPSDLNYYTSDHPSTIYAPVPMYPAPLGYNPMTHMYYRQANDDNDQLYEHGGFADGTRYAFQVDNSQSVPAEPSYSLKRKRTDLADESTRAYQDDSTQLTSAEHPHGVKRLRSENSEGLGLVDGSQFLSVDPYLGTERKRDGSSTYSPPLTPQSIEADAQSQNSKRHRPSTPQPLEHSTPAPSPAAPKPRKNVPPRRRPSRRIRNGREDDVSEPLSVLTRSMAKEIPLRDMKKYVNRSIEERREEAAKAKKIKRPMNSFMLYRSAYAERTKLWCKKNNHQVVSSVCGASWPKEPDEIQNLYKGLAEIERCNHREAHPEYKFTPSKGGGSTRPHNLLGSEDDAGSTGPFETPQSLSVSRPDTPALLPPARSTLSRSITPLNYPELEQMPMSRPLRTPAGSYNHNYPYVWGINNDQCQPDWPSYRFLGNARYPVMTATPSDGDMHNQSTTQHYPGASDSLRDFDPIDPSIMNAYRTEHNPALTALPKGNAGAVLECDVAHPQLWENMWELGVPSDQQHPHPSIESDLGAREFETLFNQEGFA